MIFFPPEFLLCASLVLFLRMVLRRECGEAMHSIGMVTIRLQSCLSVGHRIHNLCVYSKYDNTLSLLYEYSEL